MVEKLAHELIDLGAVVEDGLVEVEKNAARNSESLPFEHALVDASFLDGANQVISLQRSCQETHVDLGVLARHVQFDWFIVAILSSVVLNVWNILVV